MKSKETGNQLIIRESPGCLWVFGLFFAVIGGIFVYGALGGYSNYHEAQPWAMFLHFVGGCMGIGTGYWLIFQAPVTKIVIDRYTKTLIHSRRGLFGKNEKTYTFDRIKQFRTIEEKDCEGDIVWSLGIELADAEIVKVSSLPAKDEKIKLNFAFQANKFMYKQMPSLRDTYQLKDET